MKRVIYLLLFLFVAGPAIQSCGSSRTCKTQKYKKKMYNKCWNAKKQKMTRC